VLAVIGGCRPQTLARRRRVEQRVYESLLILAGEFDEVRRFERPNGGIVGGRQHERRQRHPSTSRGVLEQSLLVGTDPCLDSLLCGSHL